MEKAVVVDNFSFTDEAVWLVKLIWFQGWYREPFDPWANRPDGLHSIACPSFSSLEQLAHEAQLEECVVLTHIEQLVAAQWLTSPQFPLRLQRKSALLAHLCELQSTRAWRPYQLSVDPHASYCDAVREISKMAGVPVSGRVILRGRMTMDLLPRTFDDSLSKELKHEQIQKVEHWSREYYHPATKALPVILHRLKGRAPYADFKEISADLNAFRIAFTPCLLEDANVIWVDSRSWTTSINKSVSHILDLASVDLLQCYMDLHMIRVHRPDFECPEVMSFVREGLINSKLQVHEATT